MYSIVEYVDQQGKKPFAEWLLKIKDHTAQAKLLSRIARAEFGNLGDWKSIKNAPGIFEMREHYGPGYRIFYSIQGRKIILLLAGSTKSDQNKAIKKAKEYMEEYGRRNRL